ncbi:MAG: ATP-binding protein [Catenulisporales bacterium]|nr:ATP-binding protein [Catenulisporales bacterium]
MVRFVGRRRELADLDRVLAEIGAAANDPRPGRCLVLRGRRRIGKSALIEEFVGRADVPHVYFTAEIGIGEEPLAEFVRAVGESTIPDADVFDEATPGNWAAALRQLAGILPADRPSVVVLDEVPYLMDEQGAFESVLQRSWDRELSRKPVLLLLIGSDLSMMEALTSYGRPFHQRATEMAIGPLNPADVATMTGLDAADAIDAALVTGGLPVICARWQHGEDLWSFLARELADPFSPLSASARLSLASEFPDRAQARIVLAAIGSGERTFTNIARAAGISQSTLVRAAQLLVEKRVMAADLPISLSPSKERRYRITDPYLRFWFAFLGPHLAEIDRMRSDLILERIRGGWSSWRGRAVEPLVRDSLARLLPAAGLPAAPAVGGYWTRSNDVEIDIVGADREPIARRLLFLGSIKWLETSPFDRRGLAALQRHRDRLTGDPVPLVCVSRSGVTATGLDASFGPADLLEPWRT